MLFKFNKISFILYNFESFTRSSFILLAINLFNSFLVSDSFFNVVLILSHHHLGAYFEVELVVGSLGIVTTWVVDRLAEEELLLVRSIAV